jgi:hypothetical protein
MPPENVKLLRWPVDQQFWRPMAAEETGICAVGREMRDYETLIAALRDLDIPCHIAARRPGIEIPARRFTAMTDLATTLTTALHKTGDGTIFRAVAASLPMNLQIIAGYGFFLWFQ